jgi:hypothetical protein
MSTNCNRTVGHCKSIRITKGIAAHPTVEAFPAEMAAVISIVLAAKKQLAIMRTGRIVIQTVAIPIHLVAFGLIYIRSPKIFGAKRRSLRDPRAQVTCSVVQNQSFFNQFSVATSGVGPLPKGLRDCWSVPGPMDLVADCFFTAVTNIRTLHIAADCIFPMGPIVVVWRVVGAAFCS